ncbi:MAG TPA: MgtC/SapB family protein [Agitococcus sp.]|nr:MgtC/SapB family protein [Agitococcus sp.]HNG09756.1 MgtC/SapB family protein [Agitococcus sp.]HNI63075.1 MgtC/SapB family protein [Agitococcus sp.]
MINNDILQILATAFGLGLLVGLQREKAESALAGIRTFPLISLMGAMTGLVAQHFGGWILASGFITLAIVILSAKFALFKSNQDLGITTEVAALLMYIVGAYLTFGDATIAIVVGALTAVLLQMKDVLHDFVRKMGERDILAIMRFVAIALVILPILPNQNYGPFHVLNPYDIWRMVVLIVAISLMGYAAYKVFKDKAGTLLAGILGGLISSTATTVSYARNTKTLPETSSLAALAIMLASTVSVIRVTLAFMVVSPSATSVIAPPLLTLFAIMVVICVVLYFSRSGETHTMPEPDNPAELTSAIVFGLLYGGIIFAVAAAKEMFGQQSLYLIAMISGLTDVDAITLSTGRLVEGQRLEAHTGWQLVMIAIMANLVFKWGAVAVLGNKVLLKKLTVIFGAAFMVGLGILAGWAV